MADFNLLQEAARATRRSKEFGPGDRVDVKGYDSIGTVRYYGPHKSKSKRIVYGIELDEPEGNCNGTAYDKHYFDCAENHGVLVVRSSVKALEKNGKKTKRKQKKAAAPAATAGEDFGGFGDDGFGDGFGDDGGGQAAPASKPTPDGDLNGFGDFEEDAAAAPAPAASAQAAGGGGDDFDDDPFDGFGEEEEDVYKTAAAGQSVKQTNFAYSDANEMIVHAKYDFPGEEGEDLPFTKGEQLTAKDIGDEDWWLGKNSDGKEGMVPAEYFLVIDDGT